jgi:thiol-disulfide isomerase/thioredoxin
MYYKVSSDDDAINLSKIIKDGDWMVLYYAEWCGHCKTMKPEWNKVVSNIKESNNSNDTTNNINIAEIESKHIDKLEDKPKIDGYPSIKMYNNGKEIANFNDSRVASKIEEFANSNSTRQKSINLLSNSNDDYMKTRINNQQSQKLFSIPSNLRNSRNHNSELKLNNIMNLSYQESNKKKNDLQNIPPTNILNIPCSDIKRAKLCKSNIKCRYDGTDLKCKDKFINIEKPLPLDLIVSNKSNTRYTKNNMLNSMLSGRKASGRKASGRKASSRKASGRKASGRKASGRKASGRSNKNKKYSTNNYNVKKTTKNVFKKLINSFGTIGNEAKKDSELLMEATKKL